jgi:hypothetical protein
MAVIQSSVEKPTAIVLPAVFGLSFAFLLFVLTPCASINHTGPCSSPNRRPRGPSATNCSEFPVEPATASPIFWFLENYGLSTCLQRGPSIDTKDLLSTRGGRLATINRWTDPMDTRQSRKNSLRVVAVAIGLLEPRSQTDCESNVDRLPRTSYRVGWSVKTRNHPEAQILDSVRTHIQIARTAISIDEKPTFRPSGKSPTGN